MDVKDSISDVKNIYGKEEKMEIAEKEEDMAIADIERGLMRLKASQAKEVI